MRLVEAMDFVGENDGPRAVLACALGLCHDLLDFLYSGEHRGKLDELRLCHVRDDLGQCGLAGAGRSPKDERTRIVPLDLGAQRFPGRD